MLKTKLNAKFDSHFIVLTFQPNVRVLNYAPGPLLTDMYEEIRTTCGHQETVEMFNTMKEQVRTIEWLFTAI